MNTLFALWTKQHRNSSDWFPCKISLKLSIFYVFCVFHCCMLSIKAHSSSTFLLVIIAYALGLPICLHAKSTATKF